MQVTALTSGPLDTVELTHDLTCSLNTAGADNIDVTVTTADRLDRDPRTGKLQRFLTQA